MIGGEAQRAALRRDAENRAREAWTAHRFEVSGIGYAEFPKSAQFDLAFYKRPYVSTGICLDTDELRNVLNVSDQSDPPLPNITPFVVEYDLNDNGFYVGAWCAVNIEWPGEPPDAESGFTFEIDFVWRGIGIKDVNPEVRD